MNIKTEKMKVTLAGSLGHIGRPLTQELVQKGYSVTVISSNAERQKDIEAMGATAAIGSIEDVDFITSAFTGADAVFCMVPPANYFDHDLDLLAYYKDLGNNYAQAITQSGVKKVVNLSSIGAHMKEGNGILQDTFYVESILNALPSDVAMTHVRPTEFYYNLLPQVHSAKAHGFIASNIGGEVVNAWVSPSDIASVIAEEITSPLAGQTVRYVTSDELTYNELAAILGEAIGNPDLKWVTITDEQMREGLAAAGMQPAIAEGMMEMYAAINSGLLYEHYNEHKPKKMGKVKMKDFAQDFAEAYNQL
ncbi:NAD(P)H-binding protein [Reichenbachiella sp. MSK19-1]|uniref:NAD(P)H-binding protein n=1 Tax=Reichenbachiella sp. MSK19-1 TaxID=1897631 RepID=UPI0021010442|nr:NAD(P)H-binding protein [Reichenbachiella sp. MSK19-1]